jgi:hypothetical protein
MISHINDSLLNNLCWQFKIQIKGEMDNPIATENEVYFNDRFNILKKDSVQVFPHTGCSQDDQ